MWYICCIKIFIFCKIRNIFTNKYLFINFCHKIQWKLWNRKPSNANGSKKNVFPFLYLHCKLDLFEAYLKFLAIFAVKKERNPHFHRVMLEKKWPKISENRRYFTMIKFIFVMKLRHFYILENLEKKRAIFWFIYLYFLCVQNVFHSVFLAIPYGWIRWLSRRWLKLIPGMSSAGSTTLILMFSAFYEQFHFLNMF